MADGQKSALARQQQEQPRFRLVESGETPLRQWSDEALMLSHGRGNEAAYVELVRRHQRGVLNFMFRMISNRHIAEELTQEVFIALVKNGSRYQPTAKFTTYMYTIASNIVSKEWARQKRRPKLLNLSRWWNDDDGDDFNPLEQFPDEKASVSKSNHLSEISEAVNAALKKIPAHQREAFVLLRFQELSYEEIAEILDVPVGTLKSRVVRAERALRPHLANFREYV